MRILHVTESMAGGVMVALGGLARCQSRDGHEVTVLHTVRPDSPRSAELSGLYPFPIRRVAINTDARRPMGFVLLMGRLVIQILRDRPDVIHLHSTYAGLAGRLAALALNRLNSTVYSPHGFAFLNADSRAISRIALAVERFLHRLGGKLALVSPSELNRAEASLGAGRTYLLQNRLNLEDLPERVRCSGTREIGTVARITYAKAPWRFAKIASDFPEATFTWIGDGAPEDRESWLEGTGVHVSGWKTPEVAAKLAAELDIFVSTSLWEGMPLAVMEAQALGIPCVVSDIGGNVDVVEHGVTGFVCSDHDEFIVAISRLLRDDDLRHTMGAAAVRRAELLFSDASLSADSVAIYNA